MSVEVQIPVALAKYAGNQESLMLNGNSVREALDSLMKTYPTLKTHLLNEKGELRHFVNIYVNDQDIRHGEQMKTPLKAGDVLIIVPSIAGGSTIKTESTELSPKEIQRYSRHLIMPEVGLEGQKKLKAAKILCVGAGGLGSPLAMYLAAAGVGTLGIVEFDVVDYSNLQRQLLHDTDRVGKPKLQSAMDRLRAINPEVKLVGYETRLTSDNVLDIMKNYDIVIDGTDNFPTRYLVNDACVLLKKPNIYGSIFRFEGQASVFDSLKGPCYRCLYPEPPPPGLVPSCAEGGVLGILPGIIGTIQATEAIKIIIGKGETLVGRLLLFNALKMQFREMKLRKDDSCPICGKNPTITKLIDYEKFCGLTRGETSQVEEKKMDSSVEITATELKELWDKNKKLKVVDVRNPEEYEICRIEGASLIPLSEIGSRLGELNKNDQIVLHCHHGMRSLRALEVLKKAGFQNVKSLSGGIDAWSIEIDPSIPRY